MMSSYPHSAQPMPLVSAAEAHGIGWALWGYDDIMGFALPRPIPPAPVLDPAVLRALGLSVRH